MMMPGVQKPHWLAPVDVKASAQRRHVSGVEAVEGGHLTAGHAPGRRDARHAGCPVDPHRATPALALGAAPVLGRRGPRCSRRTSRSECAVVGDLDRRSRRRRRESAGAGAGRKVGQLKEEPQPQVRVALGFEMLNPAPCKPSVYSRVAPLSSSALAESTTTVTVPAGHDVVVGLLGVEEHLVAVARAAPGRTATRRDRASLPSWASRSETLVMALIRQRDRVGFRPMLTELIVVTALPPPVVAIVGPTRDGPGPACSPPLYPEPVAPARDAGVGGPSDRFGPGER